MLRIMREMWSKINSKNGGDCKMSVKTTAILVIMLIAMLFSTAWAQPWVTHSTGIGPAFKVSPAIAVPDENGNIKLLFSSDEKDIVYSVAWKGKKIEPIENSTLILTPDLKGMYEYLTVKATTKSDPWDTSVATVMVLSPKIVFDENAPLSVFAVPSSICSSNSSSGVRVYIVVNALLGKKELKLYEEGKNVFDVTLSPFTDSPQLFEYSFKNSNLKSGTYTFEGQLTLVTGESMTSEKDIKVLSCSTPTIQAQISPEVISGGKQNFTVSLDVNNKVTKIKDVWVNGSKAVRKNEKWVSTFSYDFDNRKSGKYPLELNVKVEDESGNTFNLTMTKEICVDADSPTIDFVELIDGNGKVLKLSADKETSIGRWSWELPAMFKVKVGVISACETEPAVKIALDGKTVSKDMISIDKYGNHVLKVTVTDPINNLSSSYSYKMNVVNNSPVPTPWWPVIGIFVVMIIALFLTLY
ncbi:hypothetical protein [Mesoaciditoga lauensis]|uniref:hypothetical protein n=1 Tax=Mesoaciditoga lauensis TaxID=1495039 RepID=UPI0012E0BB73|nr:hypothetical protein [Mesoaciditoga lauensis]